MVKVTAKSKGFKYVDKSTGKLNVQKVVAGGQQVAKENLERSKSSGGSAGNQPSSFDSEVKYYKADGTPVYGAVGERTVVPSGASPNPNANISYETKSDFESKTFVDLATRSGYDVKSVDAGYEISKGNVKTYVSGTQKVGSVKGSGTIIIPNVNNVANQLNAQIKRSKSSSSNVILEPSSTVPSSSIPTSFTPIVGSAGAGSSVALQYKVANAQQPKSLSVQYYPYTTPTSGSETVTMKPDTSNIPVVKSKSSTPSYAQPNTIGLQSLRRFDTPVNIPAKNIVTDTIAKVESYSTSVSEYGKRNTLNPVIQTEYFLVSAGKGLVDTAKDFSAVDFKTGKVRVPLTDTVKGTVETVGNPVGVASSFVTDPVGSTGRLAGGVVLFEGLGYGSGLKQKSFGESPPRGVVKYGEKGVESIYYSKPEPVIIKESVPLNVRVNGKRVLDAPKTSKYSNTYTVTQPKPSVLVLTSKGEGYSGITVQRFGGEAFTITKKSGVVNDYVNVQKSDVSTGVTSSKVVRGSRDNLSRSDVVISKSSRKVEPQLLFGEEQKPISIKETVGQTDRVLQEKETSVLSSQTLSVGRKKVEGSISSITKLENERVAVLKNPKIVKSSQAVVDLDTGSVTAQPLSVDVSATKLRFVREPVRQPSDVLSVSGGVVTKTLNPKFDTFQRTTARTVIGGSVVYRKTPIQYVRKAVLGASRTYSDVRKGLSNQLKIVGTVEAVALRKEDLASSLNLRQPVKFVFDRKEQKSVRESPTKLKGSTGEILEVGGDQLKLASEQRVFSDQVLSVPRRDLTNKQLSRYKTVVEPSFKTAPNYSVFGGVQLPRSLLNTDNDSVQDYDTRLKVDSTNALSDLNTKTGGRSVVRNDITPRSDTIIKNDTITDTSTNTITDLSTDSSSITKTRTSIITNPVTTTTTTTTTLLRGTPNTPPYRPRTPEIKTPEITIGGGFVRSDSSRSVGGLFNALVKRKGKFVSVGTFTNVESAFSRAKSVVEDTVSASYKVERVGGFGSVKPVGLGFSSRFASSKRDPNVVVQKRQYRISSVGEKRDLRSARRGVFF